MSGDLTMTGLLGWLVLVPTGAGFLWLVVAKPVTRLCRVSGVRAPCPFWLGWILIIRPGRWRRDTILGRVGINAGDKVLELGPGVGVFTPLAARRVGPHGRLDAIDIQPQMVRSVNRRLEASGIPPGQGRAGVGDARDLPFDTGFFDCVFLISALPEMPDKPGVLAEIRRVLRPGGCVSISEEFFDPEYRFPGEFVRLLERNDFNRVERMGGWWMYTINAVTPDAPSRTQEEPDVNKAVACLSGG